eukprot:4495354-Pyramimonas_sp.AAC.1
MEYVLPQVYQHGSQRGCWPRNNSPSAVRWGGRPFSFSASLDPLIAAAVINLTLWYDMHKTLWGTPSAHMVRTRQVAGVQDPAVMSNLGLLDPCCGSGTVPALAWAMG